MNCDEIEDLGGAYALGALPPETLREVEEHLEGCSRHAEIAALGAAAASLAWSAEEREPPPALKARLMAAIREEAMPAAAAVPGTARHQGAGFWRRLVERRVTPYAIAGVLAVAAVALIGWNVTLQLSDGDGAAGASVHTLSDGGDAHGRILYLADERVAVMTVAGLEPLPSDMTYQVWAISEDTVTGIGTFNTSASGEASAAMEVDLKGARSVAITVEPAGGSPEPTTEPVLQADI